MADLANRFFRYGNGPPDGGVANTEAQSTRFKDAGRKARSPTVATADLRRRRDIFVGAVEGLGSVHGAGIHEIHAPSDRRVGEDRRPRDQIGTGQNNHRPPPGCPQQPHVKRSVRFDAQGGGIKPQWRIFDAGGASTGPRSIERGDKYFLMTRRKTRIRFNGAALN